MRAYSRGGPTSNRTESHPCLHGMTVPVSPWHSRARASMDDRARASMAWASCFICCFAGASQDRAKRVLGAEDKRVELY